MAKCKCGQTKDKNGNCDGSHEKTNKKMNWINSWKSGNKKEKYEVSIRLGKLTILEIKTCLFCDMEKCCSKRLRCIVLNFGFEL